MSFSSRCGRSKWVTGVSSGLVGSLARVADCQSPRMRLLRAANVKRVVTRSHSSSTVSPRLSVKRMERISSVSAKAKGTHAPRWLAPTPKATQMEAKSARVRGRDSSSVPPFWWVGVDHWATARKAGVPDGRIGGVTSCIFRVRRFRRRVCG